MKKRKIAIIGSGASGCAAAHYLLTHSKEPLEITLFEKQDYAGGRAHHIEFEGQNIEVGGTLIHSSNLRVVELMKYANAKEIESALNIDGKNETMGFWNGKSIFLTVKNTTLSFAVNLILRYNPFNIWNFRKLALRAVKKWKNIYKLQDKGLTWQTYNELMTNLGLEDIASTSLRDYYIKKGVSAKFTNEISDAILRNMYSQTSEINAFAGQVGLAGAGLAGGYLFAVDGGNMSLFSSVLSRLSADYPEGDPKKSSICVKYSCPVKSIIELEDRSIEIKAGKSSLLNSKYTFDAAIIAAPLELADIKLKSRLNPSASIPSRKFQTVISTLVTADLNPEYFNLPKNTPNTPQYIPSSLFVTNFPAEYKSIGITGLSADGSRIYKLFSEKEVSKETLEKVFINIKAVKSYRWEGAYPVLNPKDEGGSFTPFAKVDSEGKVVSNSYIYYPNAFERAASSIEVNAVSGINSAKLILKNS